MRPERAAELVARWVRFYTRKLPGPVALRRIAEIDADLRDHIAHERVRGTSDRRIARNVVSRMIRGVAADASWRVHHIKATTAYRFAVAVAVGTALFLVWAVGAVGVIGEEGNPADRMYAGVIAVGIAGTVIARFRPGGMARVLFAMALAQTLVAAIALMAGEHNAPFTSVWEILGLNGFFAALFAGSAWLFRHAARERPR